MLKVGDVVYCNEYESSLYGEKGHIEEINVVYLKGIKYKEYSVKYDLEKDCCINQYYLDETDLRV